jgi:hypothetical protein
MLPSIQAKGSGTGNSILSDYMVHSCISETGQNRGASPLHSNLQIKQLYF